MEFQKPCFHLKSFCSPTLKTLDSFGQFEVYVAQILKGKDARTFLKILQMA